MGTDAPPPLPHPISSRLACHTYFFVHLKDFCGSIVLWNFTFDLLHTNRNFGVATYYAEQIVGRVATIWSNREILSWKLLTIFGDFKRIWATEILIYAVYVHVWWWKIYMYVCSLEQCESWVLYVDLLLLIPTQGKLSHSLLWHVYESI